MKSRLVVIAIAVVTLVGLNTIFQSPVSNGVLSKSATVLAATSPLLPATGLPAGVDSVLLKRQIQAFQGILNQNLQQSFEQPFGLMQDIKGIYLSRYGVVFHMEVNLVPLRVQSMFDYRPYTDEELQRTRSAKVARIQQLKTRVSEILLANVQELSAVPLEQQVAVVVHLFNMPSERIDGLPSQVVIEISRKAIVEAKSKAGSVEGFRKQIAFSEL